MSIDQRTHQNRSNLSPLFITAVLKKMSLKIIKWAIKMRINSNHSLHKTAIISTLSKLWQFHKFLSKLNTSPSYIKYNQRTSLSRYSLNQTLKTAAPKKSNSVHHYSSNSSCSNSSSKCNSSNSNKR